MQGRGDRCDAADAGRRRRAAVPGRALRAARSSRVRDSLAVFGGAGPSGVRSRWATRRLGARRARRMPAAVAFVEDKRPDLAFVGSALRESAERNHWTNFGPVAHRLEEALAEFLDLPDDRCVVMCASATAGLFALASLEAHQLGRPLRWVVSAFGFHPSRQGPFAGARVVDCDRRGLLDLARLADIDPNEYDGVLVTNVFGALPSLAPFVEFCHRRGKRLVCDSALALDAPYRAERDLPAEVVSFHHTKPWGVGEGGCVLIERGLENAFRSLINFGIYRGIDTGPLSTNAKLSDPAAAFVLDRMRRFSRFSPEHHRQYARIARLAREAGFEPLLGPVTEGCAATPANVPLRAPRPLAPSEIDDPLLVMRKYYRPLVPGLPVADDLYRHILNVPCHPGVGVLGDEALARCLRRLARPAVQKTPAAAWGKTV